MTKDPLARPLRELDLSDEFWADPTRRARDEPRRRRRKRGFVGLERFEETSEPVELAHREPGTDLAAVPKLHAVVHADQQRPDLTFAPALARLPSADHELLLQARLHLHPRGGA